MPVPSVPRAVAPLLAALVAAPLALVRTGRSPRPAPPSPAPPRRPTCRPSRRRPPTADRADRLQPRRPGLRRQRPDHGGAAARGSRRGEVRVRLNGTDVTDQFRLRPNGRFQALLRGLEIGRNVVVARAPGYEGRRVVTNHPNGGPIFSGPQHTPYVCQSGALDAQCQQPATYSFLYKSTDPTKPGLQPYDRDNPPEDVATTTTDEGVEVPFVVRREDGFQDRDRYTILTLFRPGPAVEAVERAGPVEREGRRPARRQLRGVVHPGRPAPRRLLRHHPGGAGLRAELRRRARQGLRGAVDGARTTPGTTATCRSRPSR